MKATKHRKRPVLAVVIATGKINELRALARQLGQTLSVFAYRALLEAQWAGEREIELKRFIKEANHPCGRAFSSRMPLWIDLAWRDRN